MKFECLFKEISKKIDLIGQLSEKQKAAFNEVKELTAKNKGSINAQDEMYKTGQELKKEENKLLDLLDKLEKKRKLES